jgi:hypothetical protein
MVWGECDKQRTGSGKNVAAGRRPEVLNIVAGRTTHVLHKDKHSPGHPGLTTGAINDMLNDVIIIDLYEKHNL